MAIFKKIIKFFTPCKHEWKYKSETRFVPYLGLRGMRPTITVGVYVCSKCGKTEDSYE